MESAGRLHHPKPSASRRATLAARSHADGRYARRFSRAQRRRRAGNEKLVARLAVPRRHDRNVENTRASTSLPTCVQPKIWVKISPSGRGGCHEFLTRSYFLSSSYHRSYRRFDSVPRLQIFWTSEEKITQMRDCRLYATAQAAAATKHSAQIPQRTFIDCWAGKCLAQRT